MTSLTIPNSPLASRPNHRGNNRTVTLGFEVVAEVPMDGNIEPARLRLIRPIGETALFRVIGVEDLIADRMGQYASRSAPDRIDQARILLSLHPDADLAYLERRIREESMGDYGVEDITR
ncbi:hypothetical protein [Novosphingobium lindaniclasticum]|uniref:hypothetical protein n=1 Tax=Novosphingobium lindaniclasticum TaxID=1329895 RepID=UPI00190F0A56|nr:hypothetical protein [Novosphingobium lindaniclasticum]